MACKWDYDILNNHLLSLSQMRFEQKNKKIVHEIDLALEMIMIMLNDEKEEINEIDLEEDSNQQYVNEIRGAILVTQFYKEFYPSIAKLFTTINPQITLPERIERKFARWDISLSEKDLFELIHDFYMQSAPGFKSEFLNVFENRQDHFEFKISQPDEIENGAAYFIPYIDDIYVVINSNKSYSRLNIAVHEVGHGIGMQLNRARAFDGKNIFDEVEAYFFDIISKFYFSKVFDSSLPMVYLLQEIRSAWCSAKDICNFNKFVHLYNANGSPNSKKELIRIFRQVSEFTPDNLDLGYDYHCSVGLMIALELASIYAKDPDRALYFLKKIILLNYEQTSLRKLNEMNIHLNQNVKSTIKLAKEKIAKS